ncbi:MAG TPA: hypothetical protein V6C84_16470 [Coleofasciculaceae cyanobacterium]
MGGYSASVYPRPLYGLPYQAVHWELLSGLFSESFSEICLGFRLQI